MLQGKWAIEHVCNIWTGKNRGLNKLLLDKSYCNPDKAADVITKELDRYQLNSTKIIKWISWSDLVWHPRGAMNSTGAW